MKRLDELVWVPMWASHAGCLKGCLDFLGVSITDAWLLGGSGHAFILNIHHVVCPSGPTAWNTSQMTELVANLGGRVGSVHGFQSQPEFPELQEHAWHTVQGAIDEGVPCYGWEFAMPEYYVIHGYDDTGYLFRDFASQTGERHKRWTELGDSEIGVLQVHTVHRCDPADAGTVVREACAFALDFARNGDAWSSSDYATGLDGYDRWMAALREGRANGLGAAYNAQIWAEARRHAAAFLREARTRLPEVNGLLTEALVSYDTVAKRLMLVADTFPFLDASDAEKDAHVRDKGRVAAAVDALTAARDAEQHGLDALERLVDVL
jgi:hypothetical protein